MKTFSFRLGLLVVLLHFNSDVHANTLSDTTKVYEDDKIYIFDLGEGNIKVKYKNETNPRGLKINYQIRLFYDNPIFLGSKKKKVLDKKGMDIAMKLYKKLAIKYQKENFFNDLEPEPSQFKIINKTENDAVNFFYLRAYKIRECVDGEANVFWCSEEVKERYYVEVSINEKQIYFKVFNTKTKKPGLK